MAPDPVAVAAPLTSLPADQTYGIYVPGFSLPPPIDAFNAGSEVRYTASRQRRLQHVHKARNSRAPVKQEDVDMDK